MFSRTCDFPGIYDGSDHLDDCGVIPSCRLRTHMDIFKLPPLRAYVPGCTSSAFNILLVGEIFRNPQTRILHAGVRILEICIDSYTQTCERRCNANYVPSIHWRDIGGIMKLWDRETLDRCLFLFSYSRSFRETFRPKHVHKITFAANTMAMANDLKLIRYLIFPIRNDG